MPDPGGFGARTGIVAEYDDHVGIGRVVPRESGSALSDSDVDGDVDGAVGEGWSFHCTTIADGSRTIEIGSPVVFRVGPAGPGCWEAFDVEPDTGQLEIV